MTIDLARILFTVGCFVAFLIFVLIVYRKGAKKEYDQIAKDIVDDDDDPPSAIVDNSVKSHSGAD